jgi:hypothetical protein
MNAVLLDSLENEIRIREQFLENLRDIVSGREPRTFEYSPDTNANIEGINFARSRQDSLLRAQIEGEEQFNLITSHAELISLPIQQFRTSYTAPTTGLIINRFNPRQNHLVLIW